MSFVRNKNLEKYLAFYKQLKANPLTQTSTSFLACIFLILILFILAIKPSIVTIKNLQTKIEEYQQVNQTLTNKLTNLNTLFPKFQAMQSDVKLVQKAMPNEANFSLFEKQIRYLVLKHQLELSSISYSSFPIIGQLETETDTAETPTTAYTALDFNLIVNGNYSQIKNFINDLQKLIRISSIEQITLDQKSDAKNSDINFTIKGRIFYLPS